MKRIIAMTTMIGAAAGAAGATQLGPEQLDGLLTGHTAYIAVPPGGPGGPDGGIAPFHFGADGSAAVQLPAGLKLVGTWRIEGEGYCVDWDNGPKNSCSLIVKEEGALRTLDASDRSPRGDIESLRPGNPEGL